MKPFKKVENINFCCFLTNLYKFVSLILLLWCSIIPKNVYAGVSEGADYEPSFRFANWKWRVQYGPIFQFFWELVRVYGVADYKSPVKFENFRMANPIRRMKFWKNSLFLGRWLWICCQIKKFKIADPIWWINFFLNFNFLGEKLDHTNFGVQPVPYVKINTSLNSSEPLNDLKLMYRCLQSYMVFSHFSYVFNWNTTGARFVPVDITRLKSVQHFCHVLLEIYCIQRCKYILNL